MAMKFEELVTRVMKDDKFREALKADPAKALESAGVKATPEMIRSIKSVDWASVHKVSEHYKTAAGFTT
jgi:hypothetical protein